MTAVRQPAYETYTIELKDEVAARLRRIAEAEGVSLETLIADAALHAAEESVPYDAWSQEDVAAIEKGIDQLRNGRKVRQEAMMGRLKAKYAG